LQKNYYALFVLSVGILFHTLYFCSDMKITDANKLEKKYSQKISNKMRAIDNKYQRMIDNREVKKEKEKQLRTKRLMDQLGKDRVALKFGREVKKTSFQKSKAENTAYKDACDLVQLLACLRDTDNEWNGYSITTPGVLCTRDQLQWWHCIAKWLSRATALDYRNVNAQSERDNAIWWGNWMVEAYKIEIDKKRWAGTYEDLLRIKAERKKIYPVQWIRENITTVEMMLGQKTFDCSRYYERIRLLKKKYCTWWHTIS